MQKNPKITIKPRVEKKRHIAKTITWRIVGSIDTWIIAYFLIGFFSNDPSEISDPEKLELYKKRAAVLASYITGLELITKTLFYYLHERVWFRLDWIATKQKVRHIIKTISWRLVGAVDTILLVFIVYYFSPNPYSNDSWYSDASKIALSMFSIEIVTKMVLYYLHERIWFASNFGVIKPKDQ